MTSLLLPSKKIISSFGHFANIDNEDLLGKREMKRERESERERERDPIS